MRKKQRKWKQGFAVILTAVMVFGMMPQVGTIPEKVEAEDITPAVKSINLNIKQVDGSYKIAGITDPTVPENDADAWTGTKVYYGQYSGEPILFRVLDADSTDYGSDHTMFLDCDTVLEQREFQTDFMVAPPNAWETSQIREWMQGNAAEQFLNGFTETERDAIAASTRTDMTVEGLSDRTNSTFDWCNLEKDKVFALDAREASNPAYGYSTTDTIAGNKVKLLGSAGAYWWLRSAESNSSGSAGLVDSDGRLYNGSVVDPKPGVSPAFNLNLASVLFASVNGVSKSSETLTEIQPSVDTKEWKLTLWDANMRVNVTDGECVTQSGNTITVPYTYEGSNVDQISVMITTGAYDVPGTEILYYGRLNTTLAASGTGSVTLPSGSPEGYKMYILAEDVNREKYTDYASAPVEIVPVPRYALTVNDGTTDRTEYAAGETVTIIADTALSGKQFKEWTGVDGLTFTDGTSETSATAKFTMPANAVTVTATYEDIPHTHAWDTAWTYDDTYHWHKCTASNCDGSVKDKAAHTESAWITDKEATTSAEGRKHTECTVCKKVMQTETIPKIVEPEKPVEPTPPVEPEKPVAPGEEYTGTEPVEEDLIKPVKAGKNFNKIYWDKVKGADGYYIFAAKCNTQSKKYPLKLVKDVTSGKTTSFTHKGLKKATWYKYRVVAYKITDGKRETIARSFVLHSVTNGGRYVNPSSVKVSKSKVTLKKGKSFTVKAKVVLPKEKKTKWHTSKIHFVSSNTKIATVSSKGKIKAKKKGSCIIYAIAQNGVSKKIKVTVK